MAKNTNQVLLKLTPELDAVIEKAFKQHLKETGEYITRSEYMRRMLKLQTDLQLSETNALVIWAHLCSIADDYEEIGTKDAKTGAKILREIAVKFKVLWEDLKNDNEKK